ncbi:Gfo/Idh/MocA family oxidoreductase [Rapidithrix thailandica]|uniref:Gfo/Idh/MocA family oxidoreductase n=1 Tax=Rapidithrix thailandica TaxID=413964 RepID=A0AAW9S3Y3_9BACT
MSNFKRRDFIKTTAAAGVGATLFAPNIVKGKDDRKVRIGFIGVGGRGRSHLRNILLRDDVIVPAICDIDPEAITKAQKMIKDAKQKAEAYTEGEFAYEKMLDRDDLDGVIISTPWLWHTRMAVAAMRKGKYAGVEVSAANTIEECWDLVETYEETKVPCMILENVCYRQDVMAVLQMVREGVFGELLHYRCGYLHDLRGVKFNGESGAEFGPGSHGEARWRTAHSLHRNGDLYPTHGVGPVALMADINKGNRFVSLTSTATKARGLNDYIVKKAGEDHPNAKLKWKLGDVVTTTVTTARGETIIITHDTNLPRPYSLGFRVQGTNGLTDFDYHTRRVFIEGTSKGHGWEEAKPYLEKYDHPLWKKYGEYAKGSGHGGMDFFVAHAFVESIKRKVNPPMDAYDAAAWSAITPLSEMSIANNGEPQSFPDFTRGRWMTRKNDFALNDEF